MNGPAPRSWGEYPNLPMPDRIFHSKIDMKFREKLGAFPGGAQRGGQIRGEAGIRDHQRTVRGERSAARALVQPSEHERRDRLARRSRLAQPRRAPRRSSRRHRPGTASGGRRDPAHPAQRPVRARDPRRLGRRSRPAPPPAARRAPSRTAGGCLVRQPSTGTPEGLQHLARRGHVEQRLDARAHHDRLRAGQLAQVRPRRPADPGSRGARRPGRRWPSPGCRRHGTRASVPPTVVAPSAPCTAQTARSLGPSFGPTAPRLRSARPRPPSVRPARRRPATPIVAGTAPAARTAASDAAPTSAPSGYGKPCATRVVSSATTQARLRRARPAPPARS